MRISARNALSGRVNKVAQGPINAEVTVELPGGVQLVSVITRHSAEALGLVAGKEVYAVIKASDVMVATDE